ncbi:capsule biosynthesis GfcC D2 domain-containing protein [Enterobacteriaceae bacterium C34A]
MKTINKRLMICVLSALSLKAWGSGLVTVVGHRPQHNVVVASDLAQLVTTPLLMNNTWWPGAIIATPAATLSAQLEQQQVLEQLTRWEQKANDLQSATVRAVREQLQSMQVTGRHFVSLDPDVVRTKEGANPRLEGTYTLYIFPRAQTVTVLGAVSNGGEQPWRPGTPVSHYLKGLHRLAGADKNYVTIVHPDGGSEVAPVAYWNAQDREVEPGSVLWVGFSPAMLPEAFARLNQQISSLLTKRVAQ